MGALGWVRVVGLGSGGLWRDSPPSVSRRPPGLCGWWSHSASVCDLVFLGTFCPDLWGPDRVPIITVLMF